MPQNGSDFKKANGLVALSSAAVLAVYSAGLLKTRAAAAHLENLESRVRPGLSAPRGDGPVPALPEVLAAPNPPLPLTLQPATEDSRASGPPKSPAPASPTSPLRTETLPLPLSNPAAEITPEVAAAATVAVPPAWPVVTAPAPEIAVAAPAPATPPASAAPPAPPSPAYGPWKDGTFQGVGSARHGQIQATVVIADGRIASAKIEQCWMRYPCYQIDRIVPQVAQRGTPEKIDIISGATESSNVFYWAVMDALTKAK